MNLSQKIVDVLSPGVGKLIAMSSVKRACQHIEVEPDQLKNDKLPEIAKFIADSVSIFIGSEKADELEKIILQLK